VRPLLVAAMAVALAGFGAAAGAAPPAATPATFRLVDAGVQVDAGSLGTFTLTWPEPLPDPGTHALIQKTIAGDHASLRYARGGAIDVTLDAGGTVTLSVTAMPPEVQTLRVGTLLDFRFSQGGTWRAGDAPERPFPALRPAKPFLYQGTTDRLTFKRGDGRTIQFRFPRAGYAQVQDNREWNWKIYAWVFHIPLDPNTRDYRVTIATGGDARARALVDPFGQGLAGDGPRVQSAAELKADAAAERRWLDSLRTPVRDAYGGLPGSGAAMGLRRTGYFHVEQNGARTLLVDPAGNAFFHLGVCAMQPGDDYTFVAGRHDQFAWLPPPDDPVFGSAYRARDPAVFSFHLANRIRKTGRPYGMDEFLTQNIERCRRWGFTSAGAYSPMFEAAERRASWPYVGMLPQPAKAVVLPGLHGVWDPFDDTNRRGLQQAFEQTIRPHADDALLIGYYLGNEPAYEKLPAVLPSLDGTFAAKRRLVRFLADRYGTIAAFDRAWSARAASFDALTGAGLDAGTAAARADIRDFVALFLDEYYALVNRTFRAADPNHLLLGSRFQLHTVVQDEQLCRACGKYIDVFSINYYTYAIDPGTTARIHQWSGRPLLFSEFCYSSPSDSRLPGGGGTEVDSQQQRGLAYRQYAERAASLGYVVGIEWFSLVDMAVTGRWFEKYEGQDFNDGLVSVTDRPWRTMIDPMIRTNARIYDVLLGRQAAFVLDDARFRVAPR